MEVRRRVVVLEHRYDNSKESTNLRQGISPYVCSLVPELKLLAAQQTVGWSELLCCKNI